VREGGTATLSRPERGRIDPRRSGSQSGRASEIGLAPRRWGSVRVSRLRRRTIESLARLRRPALSPTRTSVSGRPASPRGPRQRGPRSPGSRGGCPRHTSLRLRRILTCNEGHIPRSIETRESGSNFSLRSSATSRSFLRCVLACALALLALLHHALPLGSSRVGHVARSLALGARIFREVVLPPPRAMHRVVASLPHSFP
jgi:hypothetical protein